MSTNAIELCEAALLVARVYLHTRQREKLASITQGRKSSSPAWGMLEADVMMLEGKGNEARKILNGLKYEGTNDIPRLVRLALLSDMRTPMTAWNLLADAAALDSRNPDVRSFRGQLLEQLFRLGRVVRTPGLFGLRNQVADAGARIDLRTGRLGRTHKQPSGKQTRRDVGEV